MEVDSKTLTEFPQSYTNVPPLMLALKDAPILQVDGPFKSNGPVIRWTLCKNKGYILAMSVG